MSEVHSSASIAALSAEPPRHWGAWLPAVAAALLPALTILAVFVAWELVCMAFDVPPYLVPRPSQFLQSWWDNFGEIFNQTCATAYAVLVSFVLSGLVGIPLGYALVRSQSLEEGAYPLLLFMQILPKTIVAPIFIVSFGVGIVPKLVLTTFITFFPILVDSIAGFRAVNPQTYYISRCMGATQWQTFRYIELPSAMPYIFSGFKIATVYAVTAVIVVEFIGSTDGIGYLMIKASNFMDMPLMFTGIIATSLVGLVFNLAVSSLEWMIMPWMQHR